jgi:bifunctional UDP-N-acetylglucosamine pyrophosphorylase / glucosamine-1-phosphate N-acetyltransferase
MTRLLIIPAAGRGSRLGAGRPKPLVHVNGRTMLDHLADLYRSQVSHVVVVAHPAFAPEIDAWSRVQGNASVTTQDEPTGMLDAILLASPAVRAHQPESVWITWADQIAVLPATAQRLADVCRRPPIPALALPTVLRPDPYTHFERDAGGRLSRFLQRREGDTMPAEGESDMGLFALTRDTFETDLAEYSRTVRPATGTGERNFVPFVPWLAQRKTVVTFPCTDPMEAVGINTPDELHAIERWLRTRGTRSQ